ncbi:hypothetical protein D3C85_794210 [compost metagenome]
MKFRLKSKVWLVDSRKIDGRYNKAIIIGYELRSQSLCVFSEQQFFNDFRLPVYKVAYVDCFTGNAITCWCDESSLSKVKPES